jgi:hypothetical protein
MPLSYLQVVISLIFLLVGAVLLYRDYIRNVNSNYELTKDGFKTSSIALVFIYIGITFFNNAIINYSEVQLKKVSPRNQYTNITTKYELNPKVTLPAKKVLKIYSGLSPFINKRIADKLNKLVPNSTTDHLNLSFSWPPDFLKVKIKGVLEEYWPGAQVIINGSCGSFQIDSDYIAKIDKYSPSIVKRHLASEVNRIVITHLDQICNKLKPCLQDENLR